MNRQQHRAAAAEKRKADRRAQTITLATQALAAVTELSGGTLIMPSGETLFLDAKALRRGGEA